MISNSTEFEVASSSTAESAYEFRTVSRVANMGTDLVALLGVIDGLENEESGRTYTKHSK
jgi:hypothetical protein